MTASSLAGLSARRAALEILISVLERRTSLDAALAAPDAFAGLDARDRGFARALISTTTRRLGRIDRVLKAFLARPLPKAAAAGRTVLRMGVAQLLFLDTPAHAVVDSSVEIAGRRRDAWSYKGVINAVLRRVDQEGREVADRLSPLDDWPAWLTKSWKKAYGAEAARAIAAASGREAPLDLTVKAEPDLWAERLEARVMPTGALRRDSGGDVAELAGFADGAWWVQDAAAALPVLAFGPVSGHRVVDLCAAPGGKTLQLAAAGAEVTALDKSADRLARVAENLQRTGLSAHLNAVDALSYAPPAGSFDAALVDAPCSATGTLRRRPDVAWAKTARDIQALKRVQTDLLIAAARLVRPGGAVVFCTCSLQAEEGAPVIAAALKTQAPLAVEHLTAEDIPGVPEAAFTEEGFVRTTPDLWDEAGGMDGFFIAKLRRA